MKKLFITGTVTAAAAGALLVAGFAFAEHEQQASGEVSKQNQSSVEVQLAENEMKDGKDAKHMDGKHEEHMKEGDHMHKAGEAPHHGEEGHKHKDGDEHADHKDGHAEHGEHMKKESDAP